MRKVEEVAAFYETAAGVWALVDVKKSAALLDDALKLRAGGSVDPAQDRQEAIEAFRRAAGGAMDEPEYRDKVYRWVAEQRRREAEEEARIADQRAAAARATRRGRRRGGTRP